MVVHGLTFKSPKYILQDNMLFDQNTWIHKAINKSNLNNGVHGSTFKSPKYILQDNMLFDQNTWIHKAINKSNLNNGGTWINLQISKVYSLEDQDDV